MTDPFDALRAPVRPVDPDPAFAAALRARLERALTLPRGVAMTSTQTSTQSTGTSTRADAGRVAADPGDSPAARAAGAAIPYLAVPVGSGRRALEWYGSVLDAVTVGDPYIGDDGRVGHAELAVAGGRLFLSEAYPEIGVVAPRPGETTVTLVLTVPDVAGTVNRAVGAGGTLTRPLYDDYGSRNAVVMDPFGHRWMLQTPLADLPASQRQGDVGYAWLTVPDPDRAAEFYAAVLGWKYEPGNAPGGRNVVGQSLPLGIGRGEPGWHLSYAVDDVAAAVERVRAAGGRATDPDDRPWGAAANCRDDQGAVFVLHQAGTGPRSPENGARSGDLSYLTMEVVDSARFRDFYASVLGWTFTGGREDRWSVVGVSPMTGMHGGDAAGAAVPMWKVDDVAAAAERVRAAGGTATDPERVPYGLIATCTDDQGVRFYLGDA